jgi:hypothetical protein
MQIVSIVQKERRRNLDMIDSYSLSATDALLLMRAISKNAILMIILMLELI